MLKFVAAAVVATVATLVASSDVPLLHSVAKQQNVKGYRAVQIQRCPTQSCTSGTCETIVEFPLNQCHPERFAFDHGEIIRAEQISRPRTCFRETAYFSKDKSQGCNGEVVQSAVREVGQCKEDFFPLGTYSRFIKNGTAMIYQRGCSWGCQDCGEEWPVGYSQCLTGFPIPDIAFGNGPEFPCGGQGWAQLNFEHFWDGVCDFSPNWQNSVFSDVCYVMFKRGHKYVLV
jgi:hypothetical protein